MVSDHSSPPTLALYYVPAGDAKGQSPGWHDVYIPTYSRTDLPAPDAERILPAVRSILRDEGFDLILNVHGVLYFTKAIRSQIEKEPQFTNRGFRAVFAPKVRAARSVVYRSSRAALR